jgi:hypothetical protein
MEQEKKLDLKRLAEKWPSTLVARTEVGNFSGGLLNEKSMANHDSAGTGVKGRIRIGRKICYPVDSLVAWLESRSEILQ